MSLGQKLLIGTGIGLAVTTGAGVAHADTIYLERSRQWEESAIVENVIITKETPDSVTFHIPGAENRPLTFERKYIRRVEYNPTIVQPSTQEEVEKRYEDTKSKYDGAVREITWDKWILRIPFIPLTIPIILALFWVYEYTRDIIDKILRRFPGYWSRRADRYSSKSNWEAVTGIGDTLLKMGEKDLAKKVWSRGASGHASSKNWSEVENIGNRFRRVGDIHQAKELWSRAAEGYTTQNNWLGVVSLGDRFEGVGDKDKAKELWSRAAKIYSTVEEHVSSSGDFYKAIELYKKLRDIDKARELEPRWESAIKREEEERRRRWTGDWSGDTWSGDTWSGDTWSGDWSGVDWSDYG